MTEARHKQALPPGYRLNGYRLAGVLGVGGFGVTYLAEHAVLGHRVAIKEYLPNEFAMREGVTVHPKSEADRVDFDWGLKRFLDEARMLARFEHRNLVRVRDYFESNGTAYIVMDYEEGESLDRLLKRRGRLSEARLLRLLGPVVEGLSEVHAAGYLHRDIKPSNVYVRRSDESPVLLDFGAARQALGRKSKSLTAVATAGYSPPEQYESEGDQGPWTDIYALSALCYRVIAGRVPTEAARRLNCLVKGQPDPLPELAAEVTEGYTRSLLNAVDWGLRVIETERPRSLRQWWAAVEGETSPEAVEAASSGAVAKPARAVAGSTGPRSVSASVTAPLRTGERFRDGPDGPEMVVVPAGTFRMGSPHQIWVPSGRTGLSETARHFLMCTGSEPDSAEAVLANVRDRLFGWIRQLEEWSGRTLHDEVEDSRFLGSFPELKWQLRDGNIDWLEEPMLNEGLGTLVAEALDAGYELNPKFLSSSLWSGSDDWWEFDLEYFQYFEAAIARSDRFYSKQGDSLDTGPDEECDVVFPEGFDGLSNEEGRSDWEGPMHPVNIKSFAVGVYPVTRKEFQVFVDSTGYRAEGRGVVRAGGTWKDREECTWRDSGFHQTDSHPVVCISWNDAQEYVEWLTVTTGAAYRLLSEAEWEYVARAGTSTPFHFGKTISTDEANYNGNFSYGSGGKGVFRERTTPVWSFPANAFGLHDVHGNVMEWIQDCWGTYWGSPPDGSPWECPPSGSDWQPEAVSWHKMISEERVLRGGSWISDPVELRSASRDLCLPDHRSATIGFRVARKLTS